MEEGSSDLIQALNNVGEGEDDDNVSVDSVQLMAEINEFINESHHDADNANASATASIISNNEEKKKAENVGQPKMSLMKKMDSVDHDVITKNQPVVILRKLHTDFDTNLLKKPPVKPQHHSESESALEHDDESLSELSVSDFSMSDCEDVEDLKKATDSKIAEEKTEGKARRNNSSGNKRRKSRDELVNNSSAKGSKPTTAKSKPCVNQRTSTNSSAVRKNVKSKEVSGTRRGGGGMRDYRKSEEVQKGAVKDVTHDKPGKSDAGDTKRKDAPLKEIGCNSSDDNNNNWRYELVLSNFSFLELQNESFRKFINLASDCTFEFNRSTANKTCEGNVNLYYGDYAAILSGMQKLGQVTFTSTSKVTGLIVARQMKPAVEAGKKSSTETGCKGWIANSVRLTFTLHTAWTDKLKQLVQVKDWKKGDERLGKRAKILQIPSVVGKEFLSLIFPLSVDIHFPPSHTGKPLTKSATRMVEVEFASWELMETVLCCFQEQFVCSPTNLLPSFKALIANFKPFPLPHGHKASNVNTPKPPCQNEHTRQGRLFPCRGRVPPRSGDRTTTTSSSSHTERKRLMRTAMEEMNVPSGKRSRVNQTDENKDGAAGYNPLSVLPSVEKEPMGVNKNLEAVKKIAQAQGLDPNNSDVLCILELQRQLESMQTLMAPPPSISEKSLHTATVPALSSSQSAVDSNRERELAEAEQQLRESISFRQRQLQELEEKLKSNRSKTSKTKDDLNVTDKSDVPTFKVPASVAVPPNQNDQPLNFKKPEPKVEQLVNADEVRTKLSSIGNAAPTAPSSKKATPVTSKQIPIKPEDCALPLSFGKNVEKVSPRVIERKTDDVIGKTSGGRHSQERRLKFGKGMRDQGPTQRSRSRSSDRSDTNRQPSGGRSSNRSSRERGGRNRFSVENSEGYEDRDLGQTQRRLSREEGKNKFSPRPLQTSNVVDSDKNTVKRFTERGDFGNTAVQERSFGNRECKDRGFGNTAGKDRGFGNTAGKDRGFGNTAGKDRGFGNTAGKDRGFGNTASHERGFGNTAGKERGFGNSASQERGFGNTAGKERGFGNTSGNDRGFGKSAAQERGFGNTAGKELRFVANVMDSERGRFGANVTERETMNAEWTVGYPKVGAHAWSHLTTGSSTGTYDSGGANYNIGDGYDSGGDRGEHLPWQPRGCASSKDKLPGKGGAYEYGNKFNPSESDGPKLHTFGRSSPSTPSFGGQVTGQAAGGGIGASRSSPMGSRGASTSLDKDEALLGQLHALRQQEKEKDKQWRHSGGTTVKDKDPQFYDSYTTSEYEGSCWNPEAQPFKPASQTSGYGSALPSNKGNRNKVDGLHKSSETWSGWNNDDSYYEDEGNAAKHIDYRQDLGYTNTKKDHHYRGDEVKGKEYSAVSGWNQSKAGWENESGGKQGYNVEASKGWEGQDREFQEGGKKIWYGDAGRKDWYEEGQEVEDYGWEDDGSKEYGNVKDRGSVRGRGGGNGGGFGQRSFGGHDKTREDLFKIRGLGATQGVQGREEARGGGGGAGRGRGFGGNRGSLEESGRGLTSDFGRGQGGYFDQSYSQEEDVDLNYSTVNRYGSKEREQQAGARGWTQDFDSSSGQIGEEMGMGLRGGGFGTNRGRGRGHHLGGTGGEGVGGRGGGGGGFREGDGLLGAAPSNQTEGFAAAHSTSDGDYAGKGWGNAGRGGRARAASAGVGGGHTRSTDSGGGYAGGSGGSSSNEGLLGAGPSSNTEGFVGRFKHDGNSNRGGGNSNRGRGSGGVVTTMGRDGYGSRGPVDNSIGRDVVTTGGSLKRGGGGGYMDKGHASGGGGLAGRGTGDVALGKGGFGTTGKRDGISERGDGTGGFGGGDGLLGAAPSTGAEGFGGAKSGRRGGGGGGNTSRGGRDSDGGFTGRSGGDSGGGFNRRGSASVGGYDGSGDGLLGAGPSNSGSRGGGGKGGDGGGFGSERGGNDGFGTRGSDNEYSTGRFGGRGAGRESSGFVGRGGSNEGRGGGRGGREGGGFGGGTGRGGGGNDVGRGGGNDGGRGGGAFGGRGSGGRGGAFGGRGSGGRGGVFGGRGGGAFGGQSSGSYENVGVNFY